MIVQRVTLQFKANFPYEAGPGSEVGLAPDRADRSVGWTGRVGGPQSPQIPVWFGRFRRSTSKNPPRLGPVRPSARSDARRAGTPLPVVTCQLECVTAAASELYARRAWPFH